MHSQIMPHALEMERQLFAALAPGEREQFKALLARIASTAQSLEQGKKP
jgi:hypothetical protein